MLGARALARARRDSEKAQRQILFISKINK